MHGHVNVKSATISVVMTSHLYDVGKTCSLNVLRIIQWRNVDRNWPLAGSNFTSEVDIQMCVWIALNKFLVVTGSELYGHHSFCKRWQIL